VVDALNRGMAARRISVTAVGGEHVHPSGAARCLAVPPQQRSGGGAPVIGSVPAGGAVFEWLKRKPRPAPAGEVAASQPPGEVFPWPKGAVLTAVDELVLAIPTALFDPGRPMDEFVFASADAELNVPPGGDTFLIRLKPGMSVSLAKSVQSFIVADDKTPRRLRVKMPPQALRE
jgi:hypothetical protein